MLCSLCAIKFLFKCEVHDFDNCCIVWRFVKNHTFVNRFWN